MMQNIPWIVFIYLTAVNIVGFAAMGIDKSKAKRGAWRISEKMLFFFSIIGGSLGTWAGMYMFRHKTKHWYFVIFMPMIFVMHIVILVMVYNKFFG